MGKPLSADLRERIVAEVEGGKSCRVVQQCGLGLQPQRRCGFRHVMKRRDL